MIIWPNLHARLHRNPRRWSDLWRRDEESAAPAIARWEDDGGLVDIGTARNVPPAADDNSRRSPARIAFLG
jgi:hypothetical protein